MALTTAETIQMKLAVNPQEQVKSDIVYAENLLL